MFVFFFFKQKTAYEMRISDWSSDVCSSDLTLLDGGEIGLVSEAGCPAVADPGAKVVAQAHQMGLRVVPWVGPSSILLSLMASGLDGQRFAFHGYAPVDPTARAQQFKTWKAGSQTQTDRQSVA